MSGHSGSQEAGLHVADIQRWRKKQAYITNPLFRPMTQVEGYRSSFVTSVTLAPRRPRRLHQLPRPRSLDSRFDVHVSGS
ncbi:hypothetical protein SVAN01_09184 [Stagonosporopsis vannaccii]|nr:hypothetical protein SVAN01_09184 [Stagonosporopsis vannaccii]